MEREDALLCVQDRVKINRPKSTKHLNLGLDLDLLIAIGTSQQTLGAHDANGRWPSLRGKLEGGGKLHPLTDINTIYI